MNIHCVFLRKIFLRRGFFVATTKLELFYMKDIQIALAMALVDLIALALKLLIKLLFK